MEELFGEIRDEYDVDDFVSKKIDDITYVFSAKVETDFINEQFSLGIPEGDYETIGGFITTKLGRIPHQNETIQIDDFTILVLRAGKTKIDLVKLYLNNE